MTYNKLFGERLSQVIKQSGKSSNQIEREMGYTRNALSAYRQGREPSGSRLVELAYYFQVSPEYLLGKTSRSIPLNPRSFFEQLNEEQKFEMMKIIQNWEMNIIAESNHVHDGLKHKKELNY